MKPTKERNHSGILLTANEENILFDCGEGIQRQMKIAGVKPSKVTRICITHWHGDHCFGLPGLMSTMGADQFVKKLHIYGPKGTKEYMKYMLKSFASIGMVDFEVHEISKEGVIFDGKNFSLVAHKLTHSQACIGYAYVEKNKRRIKVAEVKKLGLSGPILGKLQQGEDVLFKGKKILVHDVTYSVAGKKVAYVADTRPCQGALDLAQDATVLICESTFHSDEKRNAIKHAHMTALEAGKLASDANAKKLILTHLSPRYTSTLAHIQEAQEFHSDVIFAEDFMKVTF
jgi:ribonuclease Z